MQLRGGGGGGVCGNDLGGKRGHRGELAADKLSALVVVESPQQSVTVQPNPAMFDALQVDL